MPHVSAGHLSLDIDNAQQQNAGFRFDREPARLSLSLITSIAIDALLLMLLVFATRVHRATADRPIELPPHTMVWLAEPGPGGGGGGGGNRMKEPARNAELPGKDAVTVPVAPRPVLEQRQTTEPNPIEQLTIPAKSLAAAIDSLPGVIEMPSGPSAVSRGSGSGGGAGTGTGSGTGPGTGSGLGPGSGGGVGGGVYRAGTGVTSPTVIRQVRPAYTSEAMRAHVQGLVLLACVVRPDGACGEVTVVRSLDSVFGLDLEAIKAARQWRFRPGTRLGEPVSVPVTIELDFVLR